MRIIKNQFTFYILLLNAELELEA